MTRITFQDGKVVLRDGQVGTEEACCCGGVCCGPDCGVSFPVDFLPDGGMDAAFSAFLAGRGYTNITYSETVEFGFANWSTDCCLSDDQDVDSFDILTGGNVGTTLFVSRCLTSKTEGTNCVEGLTAQQCKERFGTVSNSRSCEPNPCSCPGGGPGLGTLNPDFCGSYDSCCTAAGCVPALFFESDAADCVCYHEGPAPEGSYATYAECCADNFCPDPPP